MVNWISQVGIMNFTIQDIIGATLAFLLFPLVIVIPGYVTSWALNLFDFRQRRSTTRLGIGLVISFAVSPIVLDLTSSLISLKFSALLLSSFAVAFVVIVKEKFSVPLSTRHYIKTILWIGSIWVVFVILSLADIEWRDHLYYSVVSYDQTTRVSVIDAMTRTGVPPINPSYYPGTQVQLTFLYYFWYILCSLIDLIGGQVVDARAALNASSAWSGLGLIAVIALYLRQRSVSATGAVWRSALIGISLLAVSGLDVIAITMLFAGSEKIVGSIDVWNTWIPSWVASNLWAPHHVAALIAGLSAIMLAQSARKKRIAQQLIILSIAGLAFASALGLSVWVTLVFIIFWVLWLVSLLLQQREYHLAMPMVFAGIVAILLATPFLNGLMQENGRPSQLPIALEVRPFLQLESAVKEWPSFARALIMLAVLPVNYMLELGFFFFAGLYWFKIKGKERLRVNPFYSAEVLLLAVVVLIGSLLRSTVITSNDLGWRAWLPGQFVLLVWGVDILESLIPTAKPISEEVGELQKAKKLLIAFIALGILTTVADAILLRVAWPIMTGEEATQRYYSARLAYEYLRDQTPDSVITQNNPIGVLNPDRPSGLYGTNQMVISDRTAYGIPEEKFSKLVDEVELLFTYKNVSDWQFIDHICGEHSIDVLIINDTDSIWNSLAALKVRRPALYENTHYALFGCGDYAQGKD
jgi:hypothetical protein